MGGRGAGERKGQAKGQIKRSTQPMTLTKLNGSKSHLLIVSVKRSKAASAIAVVGSNGMPDGVWKCLCAKTSCFLSDHFQGLSLQKQTYLLVMSSVLTPCAFKRSYIIAF